MFPLQLCAKPGAWQLFAKRKQDKRFKRFAEKVWMRDNYTCQFCGFQAQAYQEVVNLDVDYTNNKINNLATACCFCAQCYFLDSVGVGDYGGGSLIYLPEISQASLNSFCHVIFCAMTNDTGYKSTAQSIYRSLRFRTQLVEEEFEEDCSSPSVFAQMLIEIGVDDEKRKKMFESIRLLPSRNRFRTQIEHWATSALEELASTSEEE